MRIIAQALECGLIDPTGGGEPFPNCHANVLAAFSCEQLSKNRYSFIGFGQRERGPFARALIARVDRLARRFRANRRLKLRRSNSPDGAPAM
jgi:hypothetical protein